ncbi:MAG: excinuclease ABC subunit UvrA [Muribaculaceae bacterium]|nr:excinuclease ABC subunit UvrA [Muribaculaceae bacterium]
MASNDIIIKGARVNNLKNIDITIPRNKLIVITGLSGSGKSSLAFDTLYAEGQRRYVESLSSYARQFLGRMAKPDCDFIKGLPPAIAIEQKVINKNSRSTVGTSTEIYDYLRLLFSRIGKTISPISNTVVKRHTSEDVIKKINSYPKGTRFAILVNIEIPEGRSFIQQIEILAKGGYSRLEHNNEFISIADVMNSIENPLNYDYKLLIDRLSVTGDREDEIRLLDSLSTAFYEGHDECILKVWNDGKIETHVFSKRFEADGIVFQQPTEQMFNFNNPIGACPECEGYGKIIGIDEDLVIPDKTLSVYDDAVMCWRGAKMSEFKKDFIHLAAKNSFPIHRPYCELTQEQKDLLWHGNDEVSGIDGFFKYIESKIYNIQYRVLLARYRGKTTCPHCNGTRLKTEASYVKINNKSISDLVKIPVKDLKHWFDALELTEHDEQIANRILIEINSRLNFLNDVGLGYLTLDRLSSTLSGGESQRINLATSLGSSLVGSLYILDEPSIGLHSKDTDKLIKVLRMLQQQGNTVIVVEHDEEIIRSADYLIDVGPLAGRKGGEIVYQGSLQGYENGNNSLTLQYLNKEKCIVIPKIRRKWNNYITINGASENNLKDVTVKVPLGVMTVVSGVSGSGKSTLINTILFRALSRHYSETKEQPGTHKGISGDMHLLKGVEFVDQNPIGKSSRSNPATYLKVFDEIRKLFAEQQLSKQMGYNSGYFSFNTPGGRCEECKGEGTITIEMQFMADITLECEHCHGKRYSNDALEVEYRGKNINDILEMTINQAIEFFSENNGSTEKSIIKRLKPLQDVGLGYVKLGQPSSTLSGGENQRVKLAYFLSVEKSSPTMFIFDEPTTGLHFHDINTLLGSFTRLLENGHTIVIIEHNMDIIKCADYIIDMGPEGGENGGNVVATGTPEEIAKNPDSYTGRYLIEKLDN